MEDGGGGSILESIGSEIIGVMSPVSICMFLVVLLVYSLTNTSASSAVRTAANLVYLESPTDTPAEKLEGALLNALVFVILIAFVTFVLVLLYYYRCTSFLKHYTRFSAFFVLSFMGGPIFLTIIQHFNIPVDSVTCFILLFNFSILGVLSVFSNGVPILIRQSYMVALGIVVAAWFTRLPEWTTWVLLVALALYDLVAVLAPGGPLKILVELASRRQEELPALVYEARPTTNANISGSRGGSTLAGLLVAGMSQNDGSDHGVELQAVSASPRTNIGNYENEIASESGHMVINMDNDDEEEVEVVREDQEETSPLMAGNSRERSRSPMMYESTDNSSRRLNEVAVAEMMRPRRERDGDEMIEVMNGRGIKLGLGDFVFYSVLVGRAAMYDLMTVYACYLAIISGLGCTLILLAVCRHALPALPISIALGVIFYFLTRLLMEPFVVGTSSNLMMF
ncbi:presenilin-like protein At1g08700 [Coffea eugenioides]|uniref:Presenilin n=2 Tax=Coffea arabica TaxID=13443 RepID=A0A6P6SUM8_COFAR|nr:presenilin-like protein At1g08700 [Coffea arabica]XP_027155818.1 presenilin-like protein At1g08700 [Coffea eugenioides]XP_027171182.1 presenilin-like protein At1g08700 [Coffea eugenioides]